MQIATTIKRYREEHKMTVTELAARVGITKQALSNIERNNHLTSLETALKIAKALGITCEELAYGTKETHENEKENVK